MRLLCAHNYIENSEPKKQKQVPDVGADKRNKSQNRKIVFEFGADENKTSEFPPKKARNTFKTEWSPSGHLVGE